MSLKSKIKVESLGITVFSIFYAIAGVAITSILVLSNFTVPHAAVLAFLSLITAYGLFKTKKWSVLLTIIIFFLGTAFSAPILYRSIVINPSSSGLEASLLNLALIIYLIMLFASFLYVAAKREEFQ
jgi:uncharacterized membrane protein (DUF2068 family)